MRIVESFPHVVQEIEHVWIPMPDGCRLAARLWLPEIATREPAAAILETGPYRKRDGTRERDERMHRWFAGHGYACVRVDVRGSGDSDGILTDEYSADEQRDNVTIIEWIAAQPWCNGAVGMIGKSWGGFAALQAALAAPQALRAVIVVCAAEDRWTTDAHWMGGCPLVENLTWGAMCMTLAAQAPSGPAQPLARKLWEERLDALPLFPARWLQHSRRDDYWGRGSLQESLGSIRCPIYAISGWADAYADAVPRLMASLGGPRKGLIGPWAHAYPHEATPEPAIGFLQEAKRWWDRHLCDIPSAIDLEPMLRVWMQEHPRSAQATRAPRMQGEVVLDGEVQQPPWAPGRWIAEVEWPSPRIATRSMALDLIGSRVHSSDQTVGERAAPWCSFGFEIEPFADQTPDDMRSLVLESAPLDSRLEIFGAPWLALELEVDCAVAQIAVRLCDVAPNGDAARVSYMVHDLGRATPDAPRRPIEVGTRRRVRIELRHAAHTFAPEHRLRVAISTAYWPIVWPAPEPVTLRLHAWDLVLPVRPADPHDVTLPSFAAPECAAHDPVEESAYSTVVSYHEVGASDSTHRTTTVIDMDANGLPLRWRYPRLGFEAAHGSVEVFRMKPRDPASASVDLEHRVVQSWEGDETEVELRLHAEPDGDAIVIEGSLRASHNSALVRVRTWRERVGIGPIDS